MLEHAAVITICNLRLVCRFSNVLSIEVNKNYLSRYRSAQDTFFYDFVAGNRLVVFKVLSTVVVFSSFRKTFCMYLGSLLLSCLLFVQNDVPFKAKDEFEIKLDYQFKERGDYSSGTIVYSEKKRELDGNVTKTVLPYVVVKLKLLKLNNETSFKVDTNIRSAFMIKKHIEIGKEYRMDLGFASDMKDHVTANEYIISLFSPEKEMVSKITIVVESDGTFKVNDEKRGKF